MSEADHAARRIFPRVVLPAARALILLATAACVAYIAADQFLLRKAQRAREAFKARHGAADFRDFIPEAPAPENDAGRCYSYAAGIIARVDREHGDWSLLAALIEGPEAFRDEANAGAPLPSPEELDGMIREKMAALEKVWPALRRAGDLSEAALAHYGKRGSQPTDLYELRGVARVMAARAILEARAGNLEEACRWLEAGMHLAHLMRAEPTVIAQLLRVGCVRMNAQAFQEVLNTTDGAPALNAEYFTQLDEAADPAVFARGLASESVFSWDTELPGRTRIGRSLFQLAMAGYLDRVVDALNQPLPPSGVIAAGRPSRPNSFPVSQPTLGVLSPFDAPSVRALFALEEELKLGVSPSNAETPHGVAVATTLGLTRAATTYYEAPIRRDQINLALALRRYRADQGSYPAALIELVPVYMATVPVNAFTGQPFEYARVGDGVELAGSGVIVTRSVAMRLR